MPVASDEQPHVPMGGQSNSSPHSLRLERLLR